MEEKIKILFLALLLAAGLMLTSFGAGWYFCKKDYQSKPVEPDTVVFHHWDTTYIPSPPDIIKETYTKIVKVPIYVADSSASSGKPSVDSTWAALTYERHFASLDSVADVWYSGYDAKIDSAVIYRHSLTQIIHQSYETIKYKTPIFTFNVGIGMMKAENLYGFALGEVTYNAKMSSYSVFGGYATDFNGKNFPYYGGKITIRFDLR